MPARARTASSARASGRPRKGARHRFRWVALRNPDARHVLPGGRIERDETYRVALRREVHEETGLEVVSADYLGFVHLHHRTSRPPDYAYPYPDMLHLVYAAVGRGVVRSGDLDGWEAECTLLSVDEARRVVDGLSRPFLDAALASNGDFATS